VAVAGIEGAIFIADLVNDVALGEALEGVYKDDVEDEDDEEEDEDDDEDDVDEDSELEDVDSENEDVEGEDESSLVWSCASLSSFAAQQKFVDVSGVLVSCG
jgi:hypothetical protein